MNIRLASELQLDSVVDGTGIRAVIWTQGCSHNCPGCHNPSTHDFNGGFLKNIDELMDEIKELEAQDGVTFSGGDPFYQPEACAQLAQCVHENNMDVWCYTGFTFERLLKMSEKNNAIMDFLKNIDILVDGLFIKAKHSYNLKFKGSSNQRIIDVQESLKTKTIVLALLDDIDVSANGGRYQYQGLYV